MATYKAVDVDWLEEELTECANILRDKTNKTEGETIDFPDGFKELLNGITPVKDGTLEQTITSNGTHSTEGYSQVNVQVSNGGGPLTVLTGTYTSDSNVSLKDINITLDRTVEKIIGFCIYTTNTSFPSTSIMGGTTTYDDKTLLQLSTFYYNNDKKQSDISAIKKTTSSSGWGSTTYSRETSNTENTYPFINESGGQNVYFSDNNSYVLKGTYNWIALVQ